jgi:hypothetical protein
MLSFIEDSDLRLFDGTLDNQELVSVSKQPRKYNKHKYTKDEIIELAKTCENKGEFIKNYYNIYTYLGKTDFKKEIMDYIPRKIKWSPELLIEEARKYNTRSQWLKNHTSSYNIAIKTREIFDRCVEHMTFHGKFGEAHGVKKYTYEDVKNVYSKYTKVKDLFNNDKKIYSAAVRNGWHKDLSKDMERYVSKSGRWTFDRVKEEALKYKSIKDFKNNNRNAYFKAVYSKWLLDVIGHMTEGNTKWTVDKVADKLSQYDKKIWYKTPECKAAYYYMKRHDITNKVMSKLDEKK